MYRTFKPFLMMMVLTCFSITSGISHALSHQLIVRADEKSFPATYKKGNTWGGMDIDIIHELLKRADIDYKIKEIPFQRSLLQIKNGDISIIPNLVKNESRSNYMNWLGPARVTCIGLVVRQENLPLPITTTDDLILLAKKNQKKIGYLTGASYSSSLDERLESDTKLKSVLHFLPDNSQHRSMLKLDRLLGYFYDAFEIKRRLEDPDFSAKYKGLSLHNYRIEDSCTGAYIGVSKKMESETYKNILKAFQEMIDDGTFSDIHRKWLGIAPNFEIK